MKWVSGLYFGKMPINSKAGLIGIFYKEHSNKGAG